MAAIVAAIATMMAETPYVLKRVYLKGRLMKKNHPGKSQAEVKV